MLKTATHIDNKSFIVTILEKFQMETTNKSLISAPFFIIMMFQLIQYGVSAFYLQNWTINSDYTF